MASTCTLNNFSCPLCGSVIYGDYKQLTQHLRHMHVMNTKSREDCNLQCSQNGCTVMLKTFALFRKHVTRCELKLAADGVNINDIEESEDYPIDNSESPVIAPEYAGVLDQPMDHSPSRVFEEPTTNSENTGDASKDNDEENPFGRLFLTLRSQYCNNHSSLNFQYI
jgi:hypothetical protein